MNRSKSRQRSPITVIVAETTVECVELGISKERNFFENVRVPAALKIEKGQIQNSSWYKSVETHVLQSVVGHFDCT